MKKFLFYTLMLLFSVQGIQLWGQAGDSTDLTADFLSDLSEACAPAVLTFQNTSTGEDSCCWNFGDGSPVSYEDSVSLRHTFINTGDSALVFPVQLIVYGEGGSSDTAIREITIHPEISANFSTDVSEGCGPLEVVFTNLSSANATSFVWDYGDGTSEDLVDPVHLFQNLTEESRIFEVSLVAVNEGLCADTFLVPITVYPDLVADFECDTAVCHLSDLSITDRSLGADLYSWDFGDGGLKSTSTGPVLDHYYINVGSSPVSYTVELQVENEEGCSDQMQKEVVVYPESEGGILKGDQSQITFGNSTGSIYLSGHAGEVSKWQKIVNAGSWMNVVHSELIFSEIPESADVWHYRAVVKNGACAETYSDLHTIFVLPKELIITPDAEQTKRAGDPDPIFTYSNSEWDDNTFIAGALSREYGEAPGSYKYLIGTLSAGTNYRTVLNPEVVKFIITSTVGIEEQAGSKGLTLSTFGNPFQESLRFSYSLPFDGSVSLTIRNMAGQVVKTVVQNQFEAKGDYQLQIENLRLEAGIYIATLLLQNPQESASCKLKLIKSQ